MNIKDLLSQLERIAPFKDAEDWDNVGLMVGSINNKVTGVMTTLDCNLEVVEDAKEKNVNTIIAHHPVIFPKIKKLDDSSQANILKALIKDDMNLIVMHTNLDHQPYGVSKMIADKLGLKTIKPLVRMNEKFKKLRVNIPRENLEAFKQSLTDIGFGQQGDYTDCLYHYDVVGQFKPNESAHPTIGKQNQLEQVNEVVIETIFNGDQNMIREMIKAHPYEEPAYDLFDILKPTEKGLGVVVEFEGTIDELVKRIKTKTIAPIINVVRGNESKMTRISIIGGSGASYISVAQRESDCLITGDVKYHEAYDAKLDGFNIIDAGHYLEYIMIEGLKSLLEKNIDVKVVSTSVNTNAFQ